MDYLEPLKISLIDLNNISYSKIRELNNKKIIIVKYDYGDKYKNFVFQTPTLLNLNKPNYCNQYVEMAITLEGKEKNKVNTFLKFINDLENKIKSDAVVNLNSWFKLDKNKQDINFQKIIRDDNTIRIKILKNNDYETLVNYNNKKINLSSIPDNTWCKLILECYAIWINSNNNFGIFFRPILISLLPKLKKIYNYNFIGDETDSDNIDIPDTEINITQNNLFLDSHTLDKSNNNSTSQLEINELYNNLQHTINSDDNQNINIINLNNIELSSNNSTDQYKMNSSDDDMTSE